MRKDGKIRLNNFWEKYSKTQSFVQFLYFIGFKPEKHLMADFENKLVSREKAYKYLGIRFSGDYKGFVSFMKKNNWLVEKIIRKGFKEMKLEFVAPKFIVKN